MIFHLYKRTQQIPICRAVLFGLPFLFKTGVVQSARRYRGIRNSGTKGKRNKNGFKAVKNLFKITLDGLPLRCYYLKQ